MTDPIDELSESMADMSATGSSVDKQFTSQFNALSMDESSADNPEEPIMTMASSKSTAIPLGQQPISHPPALQESSLHLTLVDASGRVPAATMTTNATGLTAPQQNVSQPGPRPRIWSGPGSYCWAYPKTRTNAIKRYSPDDRKRIELSGAQYPLSIVPNPSINLDMPFVTRPDMAARFVHDRRSPRVFLEECRYPHIIREIQDMNTFAVGRPKTEEIYYQMVDTVWQGFDNHIVVDSQVNTPYPLYYSESYIHEIVLRAKKEVNTAAAEEVWAEFAIKFAGKIDLTPGANYVPGKPQEAVGDSYGDEVRGSPMAWFATQWYWEGRGEYPEHKHRKCPVKAWNEYMVILALRKEKKALRTGAWVKQNLRGRSNRRSGSSHRGSGGRGGRGGGRGGDGGGDGDGEGVLNGRVAKIRK